MSDAPKAKAKAKARVYFSFDIEADGKSPVFNSMLSFGCVVFDEQGREVDTMQMNLKPEEGKVADPKCQEEFWDKNPEIVQFVQTNQQEPRALALAVGALYAKWEASGHKIVWVANPSSYDWQWLNAYYCRYFEAGRNMPDIGYSAKCIGTMLEMHRLRNGMTDDQADKYEAATMMALREKDHVAHNPEHDARVQGKWFFNLRAHLVNA